MSKIRSWEELEASGEFDDYTSMAQHYAKAHVQAALQAAADNAELIEEDRPWDDGQPTVTRYNSNGADETFIVKKESILNAYPLTNIV